MSSIVKLPSLSYFYQTDTPFEMQFLLEPSLMGRPVNIMVSPEGKSAVRLLLGNIGMDFKVLWSDLSE